MSEHKHTELPWAVGGTYKREVRGAAFEPVADAWPISGITIDGAIDNAAFIVQACNEHYKQKELNAQLLEVLKELFNREWQDDEGDYTLDVARKKAEQAIKQAEEDVQ